MTVVVIVLDFLQKSQNCVIVVRTTLGHIFNTKKTHLQLCRPPCVAPGCRELDRCKQHSDLYDSVVSSFMGSRDPQNALPREFVIFDGAQCYPELVVNFQVLPGNYVL